VLALDDVDAIRRRAGSPFSKTRLHMSDHRYQTAISLNNYRAHPMRENACNTSRRWCCNHAGHCGRLLAVACLSRWAFGANAVHVGDRRTEVGQPIVGVLPNQADAPRQRICA
jgi:hypothetical protein